MSSSSIRCMDHEGSVLGGNGDGIGIGTGTSVHGSCIKDIGTVSTCWDKTCGGIEVEVNGRVAGATSRAAKVCPRASMRWFREITCAWLLDGAGLVVVIPWHNLEGLAEVEASGTS